MIELAKNLVMPSQFGSLLLIFGIALSLTRSYRLFASIMVLSGALVLTVFSSGVTAAALMSPLEYRFPPILASDSFEDVDTIVVLSAYATEDSNMPISSRVGSSTAYRILEAARLVSEREINSVIVTGNASATPVMRDALISIGVSQQMINLEAKSSHTVDSARNVSAMISTRPFFLVTSSGHMPRALGVFRKQGLCPIPAPTDFQLPRDPTKAPLFPNPAHLVVSDLAVREYLGLFWYRVTGKTDEYW